jgi:DNA-directed RNA polymerase subunit M/transcription elongation factor TFIIS
MREATVSLPLPDIWQYSLYDDSMVISSQEGWWTTMEDKKTSRPVIDDAICPECGAVLMSTQSMTGEQSEQVFSCPGCGTTFSDLDELRERLGLKVGSDKPAATAPPQQDPEEGEAYDCPTCESLMIWQQSLNEASGGWVCPGCGAIFFNEEELRKELGLAPKK